MKSLFVLYDNECALCQKCRFWLKGQPAFLELYFIPFYSPQIYLLFPRLKELKHLDFSEKLVVISDEGGVYQGQDAWIMCLHALRDYREWAQWLAHPFMMPFARYFCEMISQNRYAISHIIQDGIKILQKKPRC